MAKNKTKQFTLEEFNKLEEAVMDCIKNENHNPEEFRKLIDKLVQYLIDTNVTSEANIVKLHEQAKHPVDTIDASIWNATRRKGVMNGQYALSIYEEAGYDAEAIDEAEVMAFNTSKGQNENINVLCALKFDEAIINKELTDFDERVYIAIGTLAHYGHRKISIAQIYRQMGGTSKPSATIIKNVMASIDKMRLTNLVIDNIQEVKANYKYDRFTYEGYLLPAVVYKRLNKTNGSVRAAMVEILASLPLMDFADKRNQLESVPLKVLQVPLNINNKNCSLQNYLLDHILHLKNKITRSRTNPVIRYSTIIKKVGITGRMEVTRAKETIRVILQHYKDCDFIKDFATDYQEDLDKIYIDAI